MNIQSTEWKQIYDLLEGIKIVFFSAARGFKQ